MIRKRGGFGAPLALQFETMSCVIWHDHTESTCGSGVWLRKGAHEQDWTPFLSVVLKLCLPSLYRKHSSGSYSTEPLA